MKVGVGLWQMRSTAAAPASFPILYRELREDALLAEELGFHSLWLSEHHGWYDGWCPSLLVAGATALAATTTLHIGTGVFLAPLHEAERVAAAGQALERLAPGRVELGLGLGYREEELDAVGVSRRHRGRRLDRALDRLTETWPGGTQAISLGGIAEKTLRRAADRRLGLFLPSTMSPAQIAEAVAVGRAGGGGRVAMLKSAWLVDDEAGERRARSAIGDATKEYGGAWWSLRGVVGFEAPDLLEAQATRAATTALVGTPTQVVAGLEELAALGVDTVVLHVASDFTRPAYRESMRRIASDVLPHVA